MFSGIVHIDIAHRSRCLDAFVGVYCHMQVALNMDGYEAEHVLNRVIVIACL